MAMSSCDRKVRKILLFTVAVMSLVVGSEAASLSETHAIVRELARGELKSGRRLTSFLGRIDQVMSQMQPTSVSGTPDSNSSLKKDVDISSIVGLALAPTKKDIAYLQQQANQTDMLAKSLEAAATNGAPPVPANCTGAACQKYIMLSLAKQFLPQAKKERDLAKARLQKASEWTAAEAKRENALPALVKALKKQADHEHQLRLKAEGEAAAAKKKREQENQNRTAKLGPLQQAIARQRFADRIRAAEDARVAALAVQMAHNSRLQHEKEKQAAKMLEDAKKMKLKLLKVELELNQTKQQLNATKAQLNQTEVALKAHSGQAANAASHVKAKTLTVKASTGLPCIGDCNVTLKPA